MAKTNKKTNKPTVTTTSNGNPLYHVGATGRDVDAVGKYLVDNGYMSSYSGTYDSNMQKALQSAKKDLLGGSDYKGATFGAATLDAIAKKNAEAATAAKEEAYNSGYNSAMGEVDGMIQAAISPIQQMYANMQTQQNTALQNAQRLSADQINNAYDLSARDYYQLYKTQQAKLPENLSKAGVTGGASESAQLKLMNNYSENLYKNEAARNNQLAGINQNYNNQIAQNSINAANQMANAYLQMAQQQLSYKRQDELAAKEQQAQAELQAQQNALTIKNNETRSREAKRQAEGYKTIHWTDENGVYHYRLAGQNSKTGSGKKLSPSSSKVKATSSSGSSGTYSAVTNNAPVANASSGVSYDDVLKQARLRLSRPAFENNRITNTLNGAQGALNYIRNSGLSDAQQKKMAQQLGLI